MGSLITVITAAVLLGGLLAVLIAVVGSRNGNMNLGAAIIAGILVAVLVFGLAAILDSFTQVEAGSVAVVKQFGEVVDVFKPGLNWKLPFIQDTVTYRTQEIIYETSEDPSSSRADYTDYEVDTATSDGQQILARYTVRFRIDPNQAAQIIRNLGTESELVEKVIKADSRVRVRNILKQYPARDLYSGNVERAEEAIGERLKGNFAAEGIELVFFGLRSIQFTDEYKNAVELKQIEAENIVTKENLAKQAEFEKDRTITQAQGEAERQKLERIGIAQGEAESIKVKAEADAGATLIKAQAQAEANRLIAESLTGEVINWQAILGWNGQFPLVTGGGDYILPGDLFNLSTPLALPTPLPPPVQ
ncbi:MAG: SPFH domain-containing protein [Chloroflexota bacterium]|nr:SPFH domain-containing protein [Chloroflexota bacterium]